MTILTQSNRGQSWTFEVKKLNVQRLLKQTDKRLFPYSIAPSGQTLTSLLIGRNGIGNWAKLNFILCCLLSRLLNSH